MAAPRTSKPKKDPAAKSRAGAPTKRRKPTRRDDPPERPEPVASLPALVERFTATLTHPVEQAIAPHAIHTLVRFGAIHRRPARTITFGWMDLDHLLALTPVEDDPKGHSPGLAATYFSVLAAFYRWRGTDGALDPATADRLAGKLAGFSAAMRGVERNAERTRGPRS